MSASKFKSDQKNRENQKDTGDLSALLSLCKRRGFLFPSSEIYGGLGSCWDYGPLGVQLKQNIKQQWWNHITRRANMTGLDSSIFMHPKVWEASGHLEGFTDPLSDCRDCKHRFLRDTKSISDEGKKTHSGKEQADTGKKTPASLQKKDDVQKKKPSAGTEDRCPQCGSENITEPRNFNLMFKSFMGPVEDESAQVYLRPETAQGAYVNFQNIQKTTRKSLPFGVAQIGKSFRNEITPSHLTFRMREFEQMEMQFFTAPGEGDKWFDFWKEDRHSHLLSLGINPKKLRFHPHGPEELAHYAKAALDIEYEFPMGWRELEGIHNRGDFDLSQHAKFSGKNLAYFDPIKNKSYIPHIIETAIGCDRLFLVFLCDALTEEEVRGEKRMVLKLHKNLAPVQISVLPLSKKSPLTEMGRKIQQTLEKSWFTDYDVSGGIGRRYRRQDEVGTPWCVTVDFDSVEDEKVTVRQRDSMTQERIAITALTGYFNDNF